MYKYMNMSRPKKTTSISFSEPILYGSISTVRIRCGKKKCPCRKDPNKRHGPYFQWTGIIDGKRTTKMISPDILQECLMRIKNYERLVAKLDALKRRAIKNAPWNQRSP